MHAKVFSIQIFQYLGQITPRVCTLVLFIIISVGGVKWEENNSGRMYGNMYILNLPIDHKTIWIFTKCSKLSVNSIDFLIA